MARQRAIRTVTCVYTALHTDQPDERDDRPRGERAFSELKTRLLAGEFGLGARLGEERLAALLDGRLRQ